MADIVPTGIDFWASSRSPDLLDPAIMPEKGRNIFKKFLQAISIAPGVMLHLIMASHLRLYCLHMYHKYNARHIWGKVQNMIFLSTLYSYELIETARA